MLEPDRNRDRIITHEEEEKIIKAFMAPSIRKSPFIQQMRIQNARIFWLGLRTGMRSGEILGLLKTDIHFERGIQMPNGYIHVARTAGKRTTKTQRSRLVPMTRSVAAEVRKWVKESKSDHLFTSPYRKNSPVAIFRQAFKEAVIRAGLPYGRSTDNGIIFHDARHTAATRMLNAGATVRDVADILGHSDSFMTMRYCHSTPGSMQRAIDLLEDSDEVQFKATAD
jgi:integrase